MVEMAKSTSIFLIHKEVQLSFFSVSPNEPNISIYHTKRQDTLHIVENALEKTLLPRFLFRVGKTTLSAQHAIVVMVRPKSYFANALESLKHTRKTCQTNKNHDRDRCDGAKGKCQRTDRIRVCNTTGFSSLDLKYVHIHDDAPATESSVFPRRILGLLAETGQSHLGLGL